MLEVMIDQLADELGMDSHRGAAQELHPERGVPLHDAVRHHVRLGQLRGGARPRAGDRRPRRVPRRAGVAARAGHPARDRLLDVHGDLRPGAVAGGRPERVRPRHRPLRVGARARAPDRLGDGLHRRLAARPGPRDGLRADRRRPLRRRPVRSSRSSTATRRRARWAWAHTARARCRSAAWPPRTRPRRSPRSAARSSRTTSRPIRRDIELRDGKFSLRGDPDQGMTLAEVAGCAYIDATKMPEGMELGLEQTLIYDPSNFVFPFGTHVCVVDVDRRDGQGQRRALGRGRRLRAGGQPDAHRRAGARRRHARHRPGAVRAGRLRRARPAHHRHVHGLRAPDGGGDPELRDSIAPRRSRRRTRSASRASARRARSRRRRRSSTPSSTRCATRASRTSTCRSRRCACGRRCRRRAATATARVTASRACRCRRRARARPAPDRRSRKEVRHDPRRVRLRGRGLRRRGDRGCSPRAARTPSCWPAGTRCCRS